MPFNTTFLTAVKAEIDTDSETLGYSGKTAGEVLELMKEQKSQDPQVFTASPISPQEIALILIRRNKWKDVKDAIDTNTAAFALSELAALPGLSVDWTGAEIVTILDSLVSNAIIVAADKTAIRDAARTEVLKTRLQDLGWPLLTIQDVQAAMDIV